MEQSEKYVAEARRQSNNELAQTFATLAVAEAVRELTAAIREAKQ